MHNSVFSYIVQCKYILKDTAVRGLEMWLIENQEDPLYEADWGTLRWKDALKVLPPSWMIATKLISSQTGLSKEILYIFAAQGAANLLAFKVGVEYYLYATVLGGIIILKGSFYEN